MNIFKKYKKILYFYKIWQDRVFQTMESSEVVSRNAHTNFASPGPHALCVGAALVSTVSAGLQASFQRQPSLFSLGTYLLFSGLFQARALAVKKQVQQTALHILPIARPFTFISSRSLFSLSHYTVGSGMEGYRCWMQGCCGFWSSGWSSCCCFWNSLLSSWKLKHTYVFYAIEEDTCCTLSKLC